MPSRFNPISSPGFTSFSSSSKTSPFGDNKQRGGDLITPPGTFTSFASPSLNQTKSTFQNIPTSTSKPISQYNLPSTTQKRRQRGLHTQQLPSLALSCQSPDSLSVHTLIKDNTCIQTQTLPLDQSDQVVIHTQLPSWLISTLKIDAPIELLCIDNDASISSSLKSLSAGEDAQQQQRMNTKVSLPLLCLYTSKGVYVIESHVLSKAKRVNASNATHIYIGNIEFIHEPLETYIQENDDRNLSIQRIRSAPYTHLAGGTLYNLSPFIPKGCMAVLLSSSSSHSSSASTTNNHYDSYYYEGENEEEYSCSQLVLFHGIDSLKNNLNCENEYKNNFNAMKSNSITISEMNTIDPLVDFSFLPSINNDSSTNIWNNASSLWNGMSIALSTKDGELYTMTPIIFHGMAIPRHLILDSIRWLKMDHSGSNEKENNLNNNNSCTTLSIRNIDDDDHHHDDDDEGNLVRQRRNLAAMVYIKDVFGIVDDDHRSASGQKNHSMVPLRKKKSETSSSFAVTANIFNHINQKRSAASWPIAVQGPVYTPSESTADKVSCIESLAPPPFDLTSMNSNTGCSTLSGYTSAILLARGANGESIQYVMIPSGVNCIPRFAFESGEDSEFLDGSVDNVGVLVEEVTLDDDDDVGDANKAEVAEERQLSLLQDGSNNQYSGLKRVVVIVDPTDIGMIHHFSKFGVVTVTTNALKIMSDRLWHIISQNSNEQQQDNVEVKTKAWSSIDILEIDGNRNPTVAGVNVSGDVQIGHVLVAVLSDGNTEAINLTAAQYLNEAENLEPNTLAKKEISTEEEKEANEALAAMEEVTPLRTQIAPLFEQISSGLSGISKVIGGETQPKDINAGALATFLSIKQSNENDIVIPLQQLNALVTSHLQYMQCMYDNQKSQLQGLKNTIASLEQKMNETSKEHKIIESNSKLISERSANILSTVRELTPSITAAEREYFKDIERIAADSEKWEENFKNIHNRSRILTQSLNKAKGELKTKVRLTNEDKEDCEALLEGRKQKIVEYEHSIQRALSAMQKLSTQ